MHKLVLVRHGQSQWNQENRFTGWVDVGLSPQGVEEAKTAAELLKSAGYQFDLAHTSVLKRAIKTLWIILENMDLMWVPVERSWRLNERHYGALQGLNKSEMAAKYGEQKVHEWRRGYAVLPPLLEKDSEYYPGKDARYAHLSETEIPLGESLEKTVARVVPYWEKVIGPQIRAGKKVLITAHGNSLRALIKHLDGISDDAIAELNIPTGTPLIYELDESLKPIRHYYLGDPEKIRAQVEAVARQGKQG